MNNNIIYSQQIQDDFWKRVIKNNNPDACWIWVGYRMPSGYGQYWVGDRNMLTHRFSYEIAHKISLSSNVLVRHMCNNGACVNPRHLITGGHLENQRDRKLLIPSWIIVIDPNSVTPSKEEKQLFRFWDKVDKHSHPDGCWLWTGSLSDKG